MQKRLCRFTFLIALALFSFLSACDKPEPAPYVDPQNTVTNSKVQQTVPSIRLGIGSMITPKEGYIYYRQLIDYLEKELKMPLSVVDRGTYREFNEQLANGGIDIAFVCGGPYVEGKESFDLNLLVVPETLSGETVYYANVIVPFDSAAQNLEDLRGKRFAFTDPQSNTGTLVPTYLLAKIGETPATFFDATSYSYAHDKSVHLVASKTVDAASVDSLIYAYMLRENPEIAAKTRILFQSAPYGIPPVVVRPDLPDDLRQKLGEILLQMDKNTEGREILHAMGLRRFIESDDAAYDSIRKMFEFTRNQSQH